MAREIETRWKISGTLKAKRVFAKQGDKKNLLSKARQKAHSHIFKIYKAISLTLYQFKTIINTLHNTIGCSAQEIITYCVKMIANCLDSITINTLCFTQPFFKFIFSALWVLSCFINFSKILFKLISFS